MPEWRYLILPGSKTGPALRAARPLALPRAVCIALLCAAAVAPAGLVRAAEETLPIPPGPAPTVGERWGFHGRWMGIPVGYGWIQVTERVQVNGRDAFHVEVHGKTNEVLSTFYPIHDEMHSYIDAQTLQPLRFEKHQREGRYRADEIVDFDAATHTAHYRSLLNGSEKTVELPEDFQDLVSAIFWLRREPLHPGRDLEVDLYTDEKIFHTPLRVGPRDLVEVLKRGTFWCVTVEPKAKFKGVLVRRARIWAYVTADERRLPLLIKATTPWGAMSAVLDESSISPDVARNASP